MDLEIKDVAEMLNVSEATIEAWLSDGKIPAYKIKGNYRFNRNEIENWVMSNKKETEQESLAPFTSSKQRGTKQFSLYRALHKGEVIKNVQGNTKEEVISATTQLLANKLHPDPEVLCRHLLAREEVMTTALGNGIALPHTRDFCLQKEDSNIVVIAYPENPIDFLALDGKPVHTLFFLFARDDRWHLHLLAKIAHLCHLPETQSFLKKRPAKTEWLEYIKEWESTIPANEEAEAKV